MIKEVIINYKREFEAWLKGCEIEVSMAEHPWLLTEHPFDNPYYRFRIALPKGLCLGKHYKALGKLTEVNYEKYECTFDRQGTMTFESLYQTAINPVEVNIPKDSEGNDLVMSYTYCYGKYWDREGFHLIFIKDGEKEYISFDYLVKHPPVLDWKNQKPWDKFDYYPIVIEDEELKYIEELSHSSIRYAMEDPRFVGFAFSNKPICINAVSTEGITIDSKPKRAKYVVMEKNENN